MTSRGVPPRAIRKPVADRPHNAVDPQKSASVLAPPSRILRHPPMAQALQHLGAGSRAFGGAATGVV